MRFHINDGVWVSQESCAQHGLKSLLVGAAEAHTDIAKGLIHNQHTRSRCATTSWQRQSIRSRSVVVLAQAMLQDAELDIRRSKADGSACENLTGTGDLCRADSAVLKFPAEEKNVGRLLDALAAQPTGCQHGLCRKRTGAQDFWENTTTLNAMRAAGVGARYGQYTGAAVGAAGDLGSNSILKDRLAAASGAWYWIEVLPYTTSAGTSGLITGGSQSVVALHMIPSVAYRVTALASGRKPNSQVVLQQTYVRQKLKD